MKRSQLILTLPALLLVLLTGGCAYERNVNKILLAQGQTPKPRHPHTHEHRMSVVGYEEIPAQHTHRNSTTLTHYRGVGSSNAAIHGYQGHAHSLSHQKVLRSYPAEIRPPREVSENPASRPRRMMSQPAVMQQKSRPFYRLPDEVTF